MRARMEEKKKHESEEELPKGSMRCPKLDRLGGKDWSNLDGGIQMRKIQAQVHSVIYQSPDTLGTARSAGTPKGLSGLLGMMFAPRRSVVSEEEITAPMKPQQEHLWERCVQEQELNLAAVPG